MDKFEYQAKLDEITKLAENGDYDSAIRIADTIEWKRVRSVRTLCMVSELYESVGRPQDSKAILYRAYRRSPSSRQILYRLTEACVQTQDFDDAVEYYTEYVNLSPNDNSKYILKYEIYKGRGSSLEEQISVLEELKSKEYTEQWAYELARLYDEAGMVDKCVADSDDLALWFHNGKYVVQALELKKKYRPLTREQQTIYDNPSEIVDMETKEEVVEKAVPTLDAEITKELPQSEKDVIADSIIMDTEKELAAAVAQTKEEPAPDGEAGVPGQERQGAFADAPSATVRNLGTVDLQNELASNMREILSGTRTATDVGDLEDAPVMQHAAIRQPVPTEEETMPQRTHIDDFLTGMTQERHVTPFEARKAEVESRQAIMGFGNDADQPQGLEGVREGEREQGLEGTGGAGQAQNLGGLEKPGQARSLEGTGNPERAQGLEGAEGLGQAQGAQDKQGLSVSPEDYVRPATLDETEKHMLGFLSRIRGVNEQVNEAVLQIMRSALENKTSSHGNVLMVGDPGNGRTTLAIALAKIVSRCKGQTNARVAKIYAEDFNKKEIPAVVSKMAGGMLIIEEAGDLTDEAVGQLSMAMDFRTDSLVVVLEDERRYLQDLLARNAAFEKKFDIAIQVPMLTNDELVEFGKYYAEENECAMDESAVDMLYENIGVMQSPEQPVTLLDVKEMLDKAMKNANRFGVGRLTSSISGKRYDENDRIIIKGKNFKKIK